MAESIIHIDITAQRLQLREGTRILQTFTISSAANGVGENHGSGGTPRGWHVVRIRIGQGCVPGAVFVGRRPTGEIYSPQLREQFPERDWILTRILWLSGSEAGRNRGGSVDTLRRFIYIHGTPDDVAMGVPGSHGCIRMRNGDVIALFDHVSAGQRVLIAE